MLTAYSKVHRIKYVHSHNFICQDQFHAGDELQEPELLNDVWDLASLYVMHICLGSPLCPNIGWGARKVGGGQLSCKTNWQVIKTMGLLGGG